MNDIERHLLPDMCHLRPMVIAGPCSAESYEQVIDTATQLSSMGVSIFRAGLWKPRTKPGSFEGVGSRGLPWLMRVKELTGMKVATEVANAQHVAEALAAGIDILWTGARTTANPFSMQEIADALRGTDTPILVKNPVNPDLELWIGAIERLYNAGLRHIGVVHRGFSSYEPHIYRNPPLWHIPIELRRRYPHIPLIGDPSHIGGKRELVASLSQTALDMGYDGLIIETHCDPQSALSDAAQQITPSALQEILSQLVVRDTQLPTEALADLRRRIDTIDNELIGLLAERMGVSREIGFFKKEHNIPIVQAHRYDEILSRRTAQATELGMNKDFIKTILQAIHEESVQQQLKLMKKQ